MYIRQTDLFWGMNQNMVNRVMAIADREAFGAGDVLFHRSDPASHLFILAQGEVNIMMDEDGNNLYTGKRVGEAFGWGALIGRDTYGGSAVCVTPVVVLKLDCGRLFKLLESDRESGYLFYRHLSRALGGRLMQAYCQLTRDD
jgi:CRP-like cAMP-binding protein